MNIGTKPIKTLARERASYIFHHLMTEDSYARYIEDLCEAVLERERRTEFLCPYDMRKCSEPVMAGGHPLTIYLPQRGDKRKAPPPGRLAAQRRAGGKKSRGQDRAIAQEVGKRK